MLGWVRRWQAKGWMRNKKAKALNADLWEQLLELCGQHQVQFIWVKGHAGIKENERCDDLAETAARQGDLPADEGYENIQFQGTDISSLFSNDSFL